MKRETGITLIILIVSIIVVLILAGVTITFAIDENGILEKTRNSKFQAKLAEINEKVNLAYASVKIDDFADRETENKTVLESIVSKLRENGYIAEEKNDENPIIIGANLIDGENIISKKLNLLTGERNTRKLRVNIVYVNDELIYFIKIENKYHVLTMQNNEPVVLENGISEINNNEDDILTLELKELRGLVSKNEDLINENEVILEDGDIIEIANTDNEINGKIKLVSNNIENIIDVSIKNPFNTDDIMGEFINYEIPYTDIYDDSIKYTSDNGWRILKVKDNIDGKYDVDIISTGCPAGIYYRSEQDPSEESNPNNKWWGTLNDVNEYYGKTFTEWDSESSAYYVAYGMLKNFETIIFREYPTKFDSSLHNYGYYKNINGIETGDLLGSVFYIDFAKLKNASIREVEGLDIRLDIGKEFSEMPGIYTSDKLTNLFQLDQLGNVPNAEKHGVSNYTNGFYWLASPNSEYNNLLWSIGYEGGFSGRSSSKCGIRPVISLHGVSLEKNNKTDVWEMGD